MPSLDPRKTSLLARFLIINGLILLAAGVLLTAYIFWPVAKEEVRYQLTRTQGKPTNELAPPNKDFAIVINKISATAPVINSVDPFSPALYQQALSQGVAHAAGTALPGEGSNIFLFAHSSADLGLATRYNSVFYLLHKLEPADEITLWYQEKQYLYEVTEKIIAKPTALNYLKPTDSESLTLMTCWPPGTTYERLLVVAKPKGVGITPR